MEHRVSRFKSWCWTAAAVCSIAAGSLANAASYVITNPFSVERFATLPTEANFPEGIAADPSTGDIFVGTFDVQPDGSGTNFLLRFDRYGRVTAQRATGLVPMTGLMFNPRDRKVYFAVPAGLLGLPTKISRIPANFTASTSIEDVAMIPNLPAPGGRTELTLDGQTISVTFPNSIPAPNGLAFRPSDGSLFITDSLQAAVFRIANPVVAANTCPTTTTCVRTVKQDPLLASAAFPQLGVNGVVVSADETKLFLTNTGDDRLLSLQLSTGALSVVTDSLEGADGIVLGVNNTLIISMALGDELAVVDAATGRILAEVGEFRGIRRNGSVRGLLFPGSIVRIGNQVFANNLALPLSGLPSEPEGDVKVYTISRVQLPTIELR
jgi:sugar lactone lactonase YvrE